MSDLSRRKVRPSLEALAGRCAPALVTGAAAIPQGDGGGFSVGAAQTRPLGDAPVPAVNGDRDAGGVLSPQTGAEALSDQALMSFDPQGRLGWHDGLPTT